MTGSAARIAAGDPGAAVAALRGDDACVNPAINKNTMAKCSKRKANLPGETETICNKHGGEVASESR
jgi:hypothetical protein